MLRQKPHSACAFSLRSFSISSNFFSRCNFLNLEDVKVNLADLCEVPQHVSYLMSLLSEISNFAHDCHSWEFYKLTTIINIIFIQKKSAHFARQTHRPIITATMAAEHSGTITCVHTLLNSEKFFFTSNFTLAFACKTNIF